MLHEEAVGPSTLELLKSLQEKEYFKEFYLVGGTALALYYGHRKSDDIDLFTNKTFDTEELLQKIIRDFSYQLSYSAENTLKGIISDVKVDIIVRAYPYIQKPQTYNAISSLSEKDIIAMKLNAIYKEKYKQQSVSHILKSLIYFDDVDFDDWPVMIKHPDLKWYTVKEKLEKEVIYFLKEY